MILRRVELRYLGVEVDVYPAVLGMNPVYEAGIQEYLVPYQLAASVERLTEETAQRALAQLYAAAVIHGSPSITLAGLDREGWVSWLLENPDAFDDLRAVCEDPDNFVELSGESSAVLRSYE